MESDETFEAISHPLRIKILRMLAKESMSFADLKRELGIKSSGKLDFHLKKLKGLITLEPGGKYTLTKQGYAAIEAISTISRYGWQRRAYFISTLLYIIFLVYIVWVITLYPNNPIYILTLILITLWHVFYSYWNIVKRRIFKSL